MSDRPAPPTRPPAPPRVLPPPPAGQAAAPTAAAAPGAGDTAVRVGLAERIQAKLAAATQSSDSKAKSAALGDDARPTTAPTPSKKPRPRGPRRARLRLTRIDPWSVMKTSFLLAIALGIVTVVAVAMIWEVIDAAGVWTSINDTVKEVIDEPGTADFDIEDYVGTDRAVGFTMLVSAVNVVLITAIATLAAFLYNMSAALLGGIEVTLAEDN